MAEILDEFPENRRGRRSEYPYDTWLDGRVWKLIEGVDFTCKAKTMAGLIKQYANRRNIKAKVAADNGFVFVEAERKDDGTDEGTR